MKFIYSLFLFPLLILHLSIIINDGLTSTNNKSDDIEYRLSKLHYSNSSGENGVTIFEYNEEGTMHKAIWKLLDGSRSSVNYYEYNECGNLTSKYRLFSDSITSENIYEYDDNCNLILETFSRSDGIKGTTTYEYDDDIILRKAICEGLNGWFHGIITYSYNNEGLITGAYFTQKGEHAGTITYSYDDIGNLIKEFWGFNGNWNQTFIFEYEKIDNTQK